MEEKWNGEEPFPELFIQALQPTKMMQDRKVR